MKRRSNWCAEPFKNIYVENIDGARIAPCCAAKSAPLDESYSLVAQPYLEKIRQQFINNEQPDACSHCWETEKNNNTSRRITCGQESYSNDIDITHLEINVNNRCNLACRICTPRFSSAWHKEGRMLKLEIPKPGINNLWKNIDLSLIEWIHFTGGEPFLSDDHIEILSNIDQKQDCSVYYNTNGTLRVSKDILNLWSKFKFIKIAFSIDDIEEHFDYQRYGAKWNDVVENLFWFREHVPHNTMFCFNRTVSLYNKHRLHFLEEWLQKNFTANRYGDLAELIDQTAHGHAALDSIEFEEFNKQLDLIRYTSVK